MTARRTDTLLVASVLIAATFVSDAGAEQPASGHGYNQIFGGVHAAPAARRAKPVQAVPSPGSKARPSKARSDPALRAREVERSAELQAPEPAKKPDLIDGLLKKQDAAPVEVPAPGAPLPARSKPNLDQMIGQMIVVGFRGTTPDDPGVVAVRRQISQGVIGGVMLMGQNVLAPAQTARLNKAILASGARGLPPIISVDQEGGFVQRLSRKNGYSDYPSAWSVANGSTGRALSEYEKMARELRVSGFNTNFGPVVDLNLHPQNPIIGRYKRSFGVEPSRVAEYAGIFSAAHRNEGLLTSAKHFPGHGSSRADSHKGFTDIGKWWNEIELEPYRDLAKEVDMVMVGHLYHPKFADAPGLPASLSRKAINTLRGLGFRGVVVTDDMEMGALRKNFGFEEAIVKAVSAGVDMLLYSNTAEPSAQLGPRIHGVIRKAVEDGRIDPKRIGDAYSRIVEMKNERMKKRAFEDDQSASATVDTAIDAVR